MSMLAALVLALFGALGTAWVIWLRREQERDADVVSAQLADLSADVALLRAAVESARLQGASTHAELVSFVHGPQSTRTPLPWPPAPDVVVSVRRPKGETACRCGGEGKGASGFHYPGAEGCELPPPPPWLEPLARLLALPHERLVEAYWQALVAERDVVLLQVGYRQEKVYRTPDGDIDNCALAAGEDPSTCQVCLHAQGGCPDADRLHQAMADRFRASRPKQAEQLGLDEPRGGAPDHPRRAELERAVGRPLQPEDGVDFEDDIPF